MNATDIIRQAGGPSAVARLLNRHHTTVLRWRRIPAHYVARLSEKTGIAPHLIRPDVFPSPVALPHEDATDSDSRANHGADNFINGAGQ